MKLLLIIVCVGLLSTTLLACRSLIVPQEKTQKKFSFGIIADCQYHNEEGSGVRKYAKSKEKLESCVTHFNSLDLTYIIHLGDFIDRDYESIDVVVPIYNKLKIPKYHVLGNHDFSVSDDMKEKVPRKMGMSSSYYDFEVKGWRFIVLNGNDISFHAYPKYSQEYNFASTYYTQNKVNSPKWNGAIGEEQMVWLKKKLEKATKKNEKVIVYCHFPVYPENIHNLWNAHEVIALLENYPVVKGYVNGHNHEGNYGFKNGIHYLTFKGMVDTKETAYGIVRIFTDYIEVLGYGREVNRILKISD
tara:strand:+ start:32357 stop:33262 length:906 start_codon:yes stop_codon:yes gene_type:complete